MITNDQDGVQEGIPQYRSVMIQSATPAAVTLLEQKGPRSSPRVCRYGLTCRRRDTCKFKHPPASTTNSTTGSGNVCKFGMSCWSKNCTRQHPNGWNPQNKKTTTKSKPTPDKELEKAFYTGPLRQADAERYKAAGIILLRDRPGAAGAFFEANNTKTTTKGVQVLVCAEKRKKKGVLELNLLGGKIEKEDGQDARKTAAREFWEETGRIASLMDCQKLVGIIDQPQSTSSTQNQGRDYHRCTIWCGPGKYALNVVAYKNDNEVWNALPKNYHELVQSGNKPPGAEPEYLVWVDWDLIIRDRKQQSVISVSVPDSNNKEETSILSLEFSKFTKSLLNNTVLQQGVESIIESLAPADNLQESPDVQEPASDQNLQELSISMKDMAIEQ